MRRNELMTNRIEKLKSERKRENIVTPSPEGVTPRRNSPTQAMQSSSSFRSFRLEDEPEHSIESDHDFITAAAASNRSKQSYNKSQHESNLKSTGLGEQYFCPQPKIDPRIIQMEGKHLFFKDEKKDDNFYLASANFPEFDEKVHTQPNANITPRRIRKNKEAAEHRFSRIPLVAVFKARIAELEKELEETKNALNNEKELSKTLVEELDNAINEMKNDGVQIEKDLRLSRAEVKYQKRMSHSIHADYKFRFDQMQKELSLAQEKAAAAVSETETLKKELQETQREHSKLTSNVLKDAANLMNEVKELKGSMGPSGEGQRVQRSRLWLFLALVPVGMYLLQLFQRPEISSQLRSFLSGGFPLNVEPSNRERLAVVSQLSSISNVQLEDIPPKMGQAKKIEDKPLSSASTSSTMHRTFEDQTLTRNRHGSSKIIDLEGHADTQRDEGHDESHNVEDQNKETIQVEESVIENEVDEFIDEEHIHHKEQNDQRAPKVSSAEIFNENRNEANNSQDDRDELRVERVTVVHDEPLKEAPPRGINRKSRRHFVANVFKRTKGKDGRKKWRNILGIFKR